MLRRFDRPTAILIVLAATVLAFSMQQSMLVPVLPLLKRELGTSTEWSLWTLSGFMLVAAVTTPVIGRLGDQYGRARVLQFSLLAFLAGTVGAACAWDIASLIAFRSLQGLGGATLPLCFSIIKEHIPPKRMPVALATISGLGGGGGAIGIMYAGLIADHTSWRILFVTGACALGLAAILVHRLRLETVERAPATPDVPGALLLGGSLLCLLLALTEGNAWGWSSAAILGLFAGCVAFAVVWVRVELRTKEPMVDVRMLVRRPVLVTNLTTVALGYGLFGTWYLVPILVQSPRGVPEEDRPLLGYGFDASVTESGLYMVSCSLALVLMAPVAGILAKRRGARLPLVIGMALLGCGGLSLAFWHDTGLSVVLGMLLLGIGIAFGFGSVPTLIAQAVQPTETGVAMGMNLVARTIGGVVGGQLGAVFLTSQTVGASNAPAESAFVTAFIAAGAASLLAAIFCLIAYPRRRTWAAGPGTAAPAGAPAGAAASGD